VPTRPRPKVPDKYMLVFRGRLGGEAAAVAGAEVFVESVVVVHLVRRKDGAPMTGVAVKTIDVETGATIASGVTGTDGKVRLRWRPERSTVFAGNRIPAYWAGSEKFAGEFEAAKVVAAGDIDAEGVLRIAIPLIDGEVPVQVSACTGFPRLGFPPRVYNDSFFLDSQHIETRIGVNGVREATFTRSGTDEMTEICSEDGGCMGLDQVFVAEDLGRVGESVGTLEWDATSTQQTVRYALKEDGSIDDEHPVYVCTENDEGTQTGPVTVVER